MAVADDNSYSTSCQTADGYEKLSLSADVFNSYCIV